MPENTEEKREPGFYWAKTKHEAWEPMQYECRRWYRVGRAVAILDEDIGEVGAKIGRYDADAHSMLRSVMVELETHHHPEFEDDDTNPMYGPFEDCDIHGSSGASIGWGNMAFFEDQYDQLKRKEGPDE